MTRMAGNVLLVLAIGLLVAAIAYGVSAQQDKQYESKARLFFNKGAPTALLLLGPEFGQPDVEEEVALSTAAIDMNSFDVAERTARNHPRLKMSPGEVAANVEAAPIRETLIVEVRAVTTNGFVSAVLADAYVDSYMKVRRERDARQAREVQSALKTRLARLSRGDRAGPRGEQLRDRIAGYNTLIRVGTAGPVVVEHARPSSVAIVPRSERDALFGGLFGLAVGAGLVALRAGGRHRSDVEAARKVSAHSGAQGPPGT